LHGFGGGTQEGDSTADTFDAAADLGSASFDLAQ
jgi:hypothetical protein